MACLLERIVRKPIPERGQLLVCLVGQLCQRRSVTVTARLADQLRIDRSQPVEKLPARVSTKVPGLGATGIELTNRRVEHSIERAGIAGAQRSETSDDAIQVRRQRLVTTRRIGQWVFYKRNEDAIAEFLRQLGHEL